MSSKRVVLIIGVGRSGTSALTRVLSLCGLSLPDSLLGALDINPRGCWEPMDIWKLNNEFLVRHGATYTDPTMRLEENPIEGPDRESYIVAVQEFLRTCDSASPVIVKQPDITEVMPLWIDALRRESVSATIVIPIRSPQEVFSSILAINRKNGRSLCLERSNAFWLKRNLLAERHSRGLCRIFVEYSNLLMDWRAEVARISRALSLQLTPDEAAIDSFLTADLYRQRTANSVNETFSGSWVTRVYTALSAAAHDAPVDSLTMDEIYKAYRQDERAFRVAWEDFRDMHNSLNLSSIVDNFGKMPVWKSGAEY